MRTKFRKGFPYPVLDVVIDGVPRQRTVHSLVALAFLGPRPPGIQARHLDDDVLNNVASNLTYGTASDNGHDAVRNGRNRNANKSKCPTGHAYEGNNLYVIPSRPNARYCRRCNNTKRAPWRP